MLPYLGPQAKRFACIKAKLLSAPAGWTHLREAFPADLHGRRRVRVPALVQEPFIEDIEVRQCRSRVVLLDDSGDGHCKRGGSEA